MCYNKHMQKGFTRGGFTIVELSLSIVFIAILSLSVVLIMMNSISAYHRGLTLNQINTTGMELTDDIRAAIQNSPAQSVKSKCDTVYSTASIAKTCRDDGGKNFVSVIRYGTVNTAKGNINPNGKANQTPIFGALCTGSYSYIWNTGYYFSGEHTVSVAEPATLKYKATGGDVVHYNQKFKLLKVKDEDRAICVSATRGDSTSDRYNVKSDTKLSLSANIISNNATKQSIFDITGDRYNTIDEAPIDLLSGSNALAIYNMTTPAPAESTAANTLFYSVSFVLGTVQGGINIMASGNYCVSPTGFQDETLENFDYCAINKFNFAAEATGG